MSLDVCQIAAMDIGQARTSFLLLHSFCLCRRTVFGFTDLFGSFFNHQTVSEELCEQGGFQLLLPFFSTKMKNE